MGVGPLVVTRLGFQDARQLVLLIEVSEAKPCLGQRSLKKPGILLGTAFALIGWMQSRTERSASMSGDTTADVRDLIKRLQAEDESARRELLERVHERLRRIAAATLRKEFPRLRDRHDLGSVVDEAWMRLLKTLEQHRPASAEEFYGLMFHKVRQVLLDMARRQTRDDDRWRQPITGAQDSGAAPTLDVGDSSHDPARLAFWTEFHHQVARLPDNQRIVFDFHYFAEFPQSEIARLLKLEPKQVSRLWLAATRQLAQWLNGIEELK
jgi:RNA polymerase sigma factor (sigma-70 family)